MPTQMVSVSESASKTLKKLAQTSGLAPEFIVEKAIEQFSQMMANPGFAASTSAAGLAQPSSQLSTPISRIVKTPGICGGRACIQGSRITVWGLVAYKRLGATDAEILRAVQGLTPADLHAALDYAAANPQEIDRDIRENEEGEAGLAG
jgi:uncharacterized protein (DUF433 family)